VRQAELQTGNTFSETRFLNPIVFNPLDSTIIAQSGTSGIKIRSLGTAVGNTVTGTLEDASPASIGLGTAGRLQLATSNQIVSNITSGTQPSSLLTLLNANTITRSVSALTNLLQDGSLGIDDRPELHVENELYSIALWEGFRKAPTRQSALARAGSQLRAGNISGAINSIADTGKDLINSTISDVKSIANQIVGSSPVTSQVHTGLVQPLVPVEGRDTTNSALNGWRYFIVDSQFADRYLDSVTTSDTGATLPNIAFLNRDPFIMTGAGITPLRVVDVQPTINQNQRNATSAASLQASQLKTVSLTNPVITDSSVKFGATPHTGSTNTENFAENKMTFAQISLASRYDSAEGSVGTLKQNLADTTTTALSTQNVLLQDRTTANLKIAGYSGGLLPGTKLVDDAGIFASKKTKASRYFHDSANFPNSAVQYTDATGKVITGIIKNGGAGSNGSKQDPTSRNIDAQVLETIRDTQQDLIDFMFHDYVNNRIVPFRAMLNNINEQVTTNFTEKKYVGRTERNIVYSGAVRDLNFTFMTYAFSPEEMQTMWNKLNYLTGLCFPSKYESGFMVPPFVKLTIGNYYLEQPGYIRSINYTIDDNMSWEIDQEYQTPRGIAISVNFSVIERGQAQTDYTFYPYGQTIYELLGTVQPAPQPAPAPFIPPPIPIAPIK
jgi:hypothetical protein